MCWFWVKICTKHEDKFLSEKFSAEMEFCKIDPWRAKNIGKMFAVFAITALSSA
jgi:hypothetical protein